MTFPGNRIYFSIQQEKVRGLNFCRSQGYEDAPVGCSSNTGAGVNLIGEEFLDTECLRAKQANNRLAVKHAIYKMVSVVCTIMLHGRMGESKVREVFGVVRNLRVPDFLGPSFIDKL